MDNESREQDLIGSDPATLNLLNTKLAVQQTSNGYVGHGRCSDREFVDQEQAGNEYHGQGDSENEYVEQEQAGNECIDQNQLENEYFEQEQSENKYFQQEGLVKKYIDQECIEKESEIYDTASGDQEEMNCEPGRQEPLENSIQNLPKGADLQEEPVVDAIFKELLHFLDYQAVEKDHSKPKLQSVRIHGPS
ncbi:UNVERIFIED_CONTAM: hypothetical protein GTU68_005221, partial [Idotea baltica]|nr:hypothetical protein [Idotea baltica]